MKIVAAEQVCLGQSMYGRMLRLPESFPTARFTRSKHPRSRSPTSPATSREVESVRVKPLLVHLSQNYLLVYP